MSENCVDWKSDKQGIKEATFIQMGQRKMLLRKGVKAALPNSQKQTQRGCQNDETNKYGPNEKTEQNSRKRTKQNGDMQPIRCSVKNTGDQDAPGTH